MKKILNSIFTFFSWVAVTKWWTAWSNIRFKNAERSDIGILFSRDVVHNVMEIKELTKRIYSEFKYKKDGVDQLWDAIMPPPQNYLNYSFGMVQDDCDGFHSTLYHCLHKSNIECYLLSVAGIGSGHCVLVFLLNGLWHVVDYTTVYKGYKSLRDAVNEYNKQYKEIYNYKLDFIYNAVVKYDYNIGKFKGITVKDVDSLK